jgi:hypothetical protein
VLNKDLRFVIINRDYGDQLCNGQAGSLFEHNCIGGFLLEILFDTTSILFTLGGFEVDDRNPTVKLSNTIDPTSKP